MSFVATLSSVHRATPVEGDEAVSMHDESHENTRHAPPRRWPSALVAMIAIVAISLTGWLFVKDRATDAAASSSRANAKRDELAVKSLNLIATSLELANAMERQGIYGLRDLGLRDYLADVITPLGGTLITAHNAWTLALGGGWACLTWEHNPGGATWSTVTRGVCAGTAIEATPRVSKGRVFLALARTSKAEDAAVVAATAIGNAAPGVRGAPMFTIGTISREFKLLSTHPFLWSASPEGVTVVLHTSEACLMPTVSHQAVEVIPGPCR
jgi:hypothetical protein